MTFTFNEKYYLENNPDVLLAVLQGRFSSAFDHFVKYGAKELRTPNDSFDSAWYAANNADVVAAVNTGKVASVWDHYVRFGVNENRAPSAALAAFSAEGYLKANADVAAAVQSGAIKSALAHFLNFGIAEGRPPCDKDGNPLSGGATGGTTLTSGVDKLTGSTFNAYLDLRQGQNLETLNSGDVLTGTAKDDVLNAELSGYAHTVAPASLKSIETVNLTITPLSSVGIGTNAAGQVTVNMAGADAVKFVSVTANNLGGSVVLNNLQTSLDTLSLSQNANNVTVTSTAASLSSANDTLKLKLDQVTGGIVTVSPNTGSNGYEKIAITSTGLVNNTLGTLTAAGQTQLTVEGDRALTITNALANTATKVDASAFKANLSVFVGNGVVDVKGGEGNDTIRFNAGEFTDTDKVDGGAGTDAIRAAYADLIAITTADANVKSIETLIVDTAGTANTLRADLIGDAVKTVVFANGGNAADTVRFASGTDLAVTYVNQLGLLGAGAQNFGALTVEANGTASTDKLTLTLNGDDLTTANQVETNAYTVGALNLDSNSRSFEQLAIVSNNSGGTHSIGAITLAATPGITNEITISGNSNLTFTGLVTADKIDASGLTNNAGLTMSNAAATNAVGGIYIQGSAGNDQLVGSAVGDTIRSGAGNDTVIGGGGADGIILEGGNNRVVFGETIASGSQLTTAFYDVVTGFVVGATAATGDRINVDVGTNIVGLAQLALTDAGANALDPAALAQTAVTTISLAQGQALTAAGTDTFLKLTTGVVTTGLTAEQAFDLAIGSGALTVTAASTMLASFYDTTNSRAVLVSVGSNSGGGNTLINAADTVNVVGMIDMTAADYVNFGANNIFLV